jgi:glycosyltransferase involved in cell wall biosynthesis
MLKNLQPSVSIIIKALNEERHIASAIESALAALDGIDGEVILADGASTDRTVEIARRYPIKIVRLNNIADRSCGAGSQLGFQHSRGQYVCHMDGDMQLHNGFLPAAIRFLEENPAAAGVGGLNIDREISNLEFAQRTKRHDPDRAPGPVTRLNGSGVYRRAAIESVGYLTDRNLHGGEELDLGGRLHARGWTLAKIDRPAVDHYGHTVSSYRLLLRRFVTRNSFGTGEAFRAAIGRSHFGFVVRNDRNLILCFLVAAWWVSIAATPFALSGLPAVLAVGALILFPIAAMSLRWRSVSNGLYSVAAWNVFALSFLPGFMGSRVSPTRWIDGTVVEDAPVAPNGAALEPRPDRRARGTATTASQQD